MNVLAVVGILALRIRMTTQPMLCAGLVASVVLVSSAFAADGDWQVDFAKPKTDDERRIVKVLQQEGGVADMVDLFSSLFNLNKRVTLQVGAEEGPHYEPEAEIITLPYAFALEIEQRFLDYGDPSRVDIEAVDQLILDVVMHTLFHELGHALMYQFSFPLFFEEEDVVDALANHLLLEYTEYGADVATSAAEMYRLEAEDIETFEATDYWADHSLDWQRHYDVYCAVYGADPDTHADIIEDIFEDDEEQADLCIDTYQRVSDAWAPLLKPVLAE